MNSNIRTPYKYERVYEPDGRSCNGLQTEWNCGYARGFNATYLLDNPRFHSLCGEFVRNNNVKRQPEYKDLILFQVKDGN